MKFNYSFSLQQRIFVKENEKLLKKFGMFKKYDDSKNFLKEHPHLACEETANYLVIWCINLEVEEVSIFSFFFKIFVHVLRCFKIT